MREASRFSPERALARRGLSVHAVACLKRDFFAENHLVEAKDGKRYVLKLSRPLGFLAGRERRLYRRLQGLDGIPALGPVQGETWLLHEWVDGRTLASLFDEYAREVESGLFADPRVPSDFFVRLEALVREVHARGVIVLDLSKRDNVIVRKDGRPALVDFQISVAFPPERGRLLGRAFAELARADLYQVYKHRRRHGFARNEEEWRAGRDRSALHSFHHRFIRNPWLAFRRRFLKAEW